ncbi:lipoprotein LpqV [Mycolicibacterium vaccae]|uniref:lipoprotein LpqV n=1 Tax=Mycolicibacterium vaccae TaxID=1810 RepID=UPI003CEE69D5
MRRSAVGLAGVLATSAVALWGCSSGGEPAPEPTSSPSTTTAPSPSPAAPGDVGVSPGGVTTAVGAPAESTEDDYFQTCRAAKTWMQGQGGDPAAQVEPYLKTLQEGGPVGAGLFEKPWPELTPGQQAAVIVAVEAAADDLCG